MPHDLLLTTEIDILVLLLVACLAAIAELERAETLDRIELVPRPLEDIA